MSTIRRGCDADTLAAAKLKCLDLAHDSEVINRALALLAGVPEPLTAAERNEAARVKGAAATSRKYAAKRKRREKRTS